MHLFSTRTTNSRLRAYVSTWYGLGSGFRAIGDFSFKRFGALITLGMTSSKSRILMARSPNKVPAAPKNSPM